MQDREKINCGVAWKSFFSQRGRKYATCRLENLRIYSEKQPAAKNAIYEYLGNGLENLYAGNNLILVGPVGTGKDHLLAGAFHESLRRGFHTKKHGPREGKSISVRYQNGAKMFSLLRETFSSKIKESEIIGELIICDLLILSDLCQSSCRLSDYQLNVVYQIVEQRYSNRLPTWFSINVKDKLELEEMFGMAIVDRMRDGAKFVVCDWPSYRKTSGCN